MILHNISVSMNSLKNWQQHSQVLFPLPSEASEQSEERTSQLQTGPNCPQLRWLYCFCLFWGVWLSCSTYFPEFYSLLSSHRMFCFCTYIHLLLSIHATYSIRHIIFQSPVCTEKTDYCVVQMECIDEQVLHP